MTGPRIAIAGVGNWRLGADRIGPRVLERLQGRYGPEVLLCDIGSGGLSLLDHLDGQDLLVVVDACLMGGAPGEIHLLRPCDGEVPPTGSSVHQIGPLEAMAVAARLLPSRLPKRTLIIAVETEGLDEAGEERATEEVIAVLDRELGPAREPL